MDQILTGSLTGGEYEKLKARLGCPTLSELKYYSDFYSLMLVWEGVAQMAPNQLLQDPNKKPILRTVNVVLSLEDRLQKGLTKFDHQQGLRIFKSVREESLNLASIISGGNINETLLNLGKIKSLTGDLYQQGLKFLSQTLDVLEQVGATDMDGMRVEKLELEANLPKYEPGSVMHSTISERLVKVTSSLKLVKSYSDKTDELLYQAELCRDSIREIRLQLPELMGQKSRDELDRVMLELRTRMEFAQRVQTEYKAQGL